LITSSNTSGTRRHFGCVELNCSDRFIPKSCQPRDPRYCLHQQLDLLASQFRDIQKESGKIAPWSSNALHKPARHGIGFQIDAHNRNRARRLQRGPDTIWVADTYPASRSPWKNASEFSLLVPWMVPTLGSSPAGCCARAAIGHVAAPPSSVMKLRLLNRSKCIQCPLAKDTG
jgi:hypothetical protein